MTSVCNPYVSIKPGNELKKENLKKKFKTMHSQYKYKGDSRYLSFHERLCRFNQNEIKDPKSTVL